MSKSISQNNENQEKAKPRAGSLKVSRDPVKRISTNRCINKDKLKESEKKFSL